MCKDLQGVAGDQLANNVKRVMHNESKAFAARVKRNPDVDRELRASILAEESSFANARKEFREQMEHKKETKRAKE